MEKIWQQGSKIKFFNPVTEIAKMKCKRGWKWRSTEVPKNSGKIKTGTEVTPVSRVSQEECQNQEWKYGTWNQSASGDRSDGQQSFPRTVAKSGPKILESSLKCIRNACELKQIFSRLVTIPGAENQSASGDRSDGHQSFPRTVAKPRPKIWQSALECMQDANDIEQGFSRGVTKPRAELCKLEPECKRG